MKKLVRTLREAIAQSGLRDGMSISFHHHLRNGDFVLNEVMREIALMGIKDLTLCASSLFDVHAPLIGHMQSGVVTGIEASYIGPLIGRAISQGQLARPALFRSHGGRPADIESGETGINVAFIAAPTCDRNGNLSGKFGPSACGALGYAVADAEHAQHVVALTDNLVDKLDDFCIAGKWVSSVVQLPSLGDPRGIASGTTRITRDPVGLCMARDAAKLIACSGLLEDGFSFQTGAGGASLAVAQYIKEAMLTRGVVGSFAMGGITALLVDMLRSGCFQKLYDVQCFDLDAVASIREDERHREISASRYASPTNPDALVNALDVVILGATEMDTQFNVNVHTDSNGLIMGGSGGHSDTARGANLSIVVAPIHRARLPLIVDRAQCVTTPGCDIDALVTQRGIALNPRRAGLARALTRAGLKVMDIEELKRTCEDITGTPRRVDNSAGRVVARVKHPSGRIIDEIRQVNT